MKAGRIEINGAEHAAWRALYVDFDGKQVAHFGIDPTADKGPRLFGGLGRRQFNVPLPHIRWRACMRTNYHPLVMKLYQAQQRILFAMDRRYRR